MNQPTMAALALALVLAPSLAMAQAPKVTANVDRAQVSLGDQLVLTLTVEGSQSAIPTLAPMPDFTVYSRGSTTQMRIINGVASSSVAYNYVLVPKRPGTLAIDPATIKVGGQTYQSKRIAIKVVEGKAETSRSDEMFLTARVSALKPYVGQQVVFTLRFYRRVRLANADLELPDFGGALVEDLGEQRDFNTTHNGMQYAVTELKKALFIQEPGELTIGAARINAAVVISHRRGGQSAFDSFFGQGMFGRSETQKRVVQSRPITLEVRALPSPPKGFTGLIGEFGLKAQLSKTALKVGESSTLTINVSGAGNVKSIVEPIIEGLDNFKVYDDKPTSTVETKNARVTGSKIFRKALVPLRPGDLTLPPIRLVYFDTKKGTYRTAQSAAFMMRISPAEGQEDLKLTELLSPSSGKVAVTVLGDDILPIYKNLDALRSPWQLPWAAWGGLMFAPPLMFLGLALLHRRRERDAVDIAGRRHRTALKAAKPHLARAREAARAGRATEAAGHASLGLRTFIGDKVDLEGSALTAGEVRGSLTDAGVDADLTEATVALLEQCEAAQYGAGDLGSADSLVPRLEGLLRQLDRSLSR